MAVNDIKAITPPAGVDSAQFNGLRDELIRAVSEHGVSKAHPPTADYNRITDLAIVDYTGYSALEWSYMCVGDYDQNGEVNIADLTPLAFHLGKKGGFDFSTIESVLDGDGNGEINSSDTTPIGQNFNTTITAFNVYKSLNPADCPDSAGEPNGPGTVPVGTMPARIALNPDGKRARISYPMQDVQGGMYYWVRPSCDGDVGISSEVATHLPAGWPMDGHDARKSRQSDAVGPEVERIKWVFGTFSAIQSPPVVGPDGTVVVVSKDKHIYAVDANGQEKWQYPCSGDSLTRLCIAADGSIYYNDESQVHALNSNGTHKWTYPASDDFGSPVIGADSIIYVMGKKGLYAIHQNGLIKWMHEKPTEYVFDPLILRDGSLYCCFRGYSSSADTTTVLNIGTDGSVLSSTQVNEKLHQPSLTSGDDLVASSEAGTLIIIRKGSTPASIGQHLTAPWDYPSMGSDGTVYVSTISDSGAELIAMNSQGLVNWRLASNDGRVALPALDGDGKIYCGSDSCALILVDYLGRVNWYSSVRSKGTPPVIGPDGSVYVGCLNGNLYAFGHAE